MTAELLEIMAKRNARTELVVKGYMGMADFYATDDGEKNDLALGVAYLIADLMHFADSIGEEWEGLVGWGLEHYHVETEDDEEE